MTIKAIIWDLGGVLVRTENLQPRDALATRLGMSRREINSVVFGHLDDRGAQIGKISADQHWENIREHLQISSEEIPEFRREFFAGDVLDTELVEYIRELKRKYQTALLSNALSNLRKLLFEDWKIDDAFDQIVISAEVGLLKPDSKIYELTLKRLDVEPGESVFIDDWIKNIEAAQALGLHTVHFQNPQQARAELDALLKDNS